MKTKSCHTCHKEITVAYRVRIAESKTWIFVCESCCNTHKTAPGYTYGGTWKGKRH